MVPLSRVQVRTGPLWDRIEGRAHIALASTESIKASDSQGWGCRAWFCWRPVRL